MLKYCTPTKELSLVHTHTHTQKLLTPLHTHTYIHTYIHTQSRTRLQSGIWLCLLKVTLHIPLFVSEFVVVVDKLTNWNENQLSLRCKFNFKWLVIFFLRLMFNRSAYTTIEVVCIKKNPHLNGASYHSHTCRHWICIKSGQVHYTGWPRKNATTLIINFKDIVNKNGFVFYFPGRKFIFQENDTMTINFGRGIWILGLF